MSRSAARPIEPEETAPAADLPCVDGPRATAGRGARVRALLTWFGVDPRSGDLPVDPARACATTGCLRPVLLGEPLCPVHLGLVAPEELPSTVRPSRPRVTRALGLAGLDLALGVAAALLLDAAGFFAIGLAAAVAVVLSLAARRLERGLLAALLGTAGFFGGAVLFFAAVLGAGLALLPALLA